MDKKRPADEALYADMIREYRRNEKKRRAQASRMKLIHKLKREPEPEPELERTPDPTPEPEQRPELESESDVEFEDVNLSESEEEPEVNDVSISLNASEARHLTRTHQRRLKKPQRLVMHKLALIAWTLHAQLRNKWLARNELLQSPTLAAILPESVRMEIFPPDHLTDFLKSKRFVGGLEHAMEVWRRRFHVIRPGLASRGVEFGDITPNFEVYAFSLLSLKGSADMLGQGFVALIRSLGLEARLVCSLQPPDNLAADTKQVPIPGESNCPLYWAEVWDPYVNKWIVVDPLTSTVRLPTRSKVKLKIEPPQADHLNVLRYCLGFDSYGYARDVTRRYASAYNSRTRKKRLPYAESSEEFLDSLFGVFAKTDFTRFDSSEMMELARYPALEGIPTRVQDFIGHPEYALKEQLHKNEVLKPDAQPVGTLAGKEVSYIYRRSDVLTARSAQSWYKQGREVIIGVQPRARRTTKNRLTGEQDEVGLYTYDQTKEYEPPRVENGIVPKSVYRTVDVFTPQMCPLGATHIPLKIAVTAAKILHIDYANAVVKVEYGKRGAQSSTLGVVVANEYVDALYAVIDALEQQEKEKREHDDFLRILKLWRQFIMGIQIRERVDSMNPEAEPEEIKEEEEEEEKLAAEVRDEQPAVHRNFHRLIRSNVPIQRLSARHTTGGRPNSLAGNVHEMSAHSGSHNNLEGSNEGRHNPKHDEHVEVNKHEAPANFSVPLQDSPHDSFDDIDNDEISESDL